MQTKLILIEGKNMEKRIGLTSVGLLAVGPAGLTSGQSMYSGDPGFRALLLTPQPKETVYDRFVECR